MKVRPSIYRSCINTAEHLVALLSLGKSLVLNAVLFIVSLAFIVMLARTVMTATITISPVPVPEEMSKRGYTPVVVAERIASAMLDINRKTRTKREKERILGTAEQPDIQAPGESVSFLTIVKYTKQLLGIKDVMLQAEITRDSDNYTAQIRVIDGPYDGSSRIVTSPVSADVSSFLFSVTKGAMQVSQPYIFAVYETGRSQSLCEGSLDCDYAAQIATYEEILSRSPQGPDAKWALVAKGKLLGELGDYEGEVKAYQRAIALDPKFAIAFNNWGVTLADIGQSDAAIEKFKKAIEVNPKDAIAYRNWGDTLFSSEREEQKIEAIKKYRKAIEVDPEDAGAYNQLANKLGDMGNDEEAIENYRIATELNPKLAVAYCNWGVTLAGIGNKAERNGRRKEAVEKYREATEKYNIAVELNSKYPRVANDLAFNCLLK